MASSLTRTAAPRSISSSATPDDPRSRRLTLVGAVFQGDFFSASAHASPPEWDVPLSTKYLRSIERQTPVARPNPPGWVTSRLLHRMIVAEKSDCCGPPRFRRSPRCVPRCRIEGSASETVIVIRDRPSPTDRRKGVRKERTSSSSGSCADSRGATGKQGWPSLAVTSPVGRCRHVGQPAS